MNVYEIITDKIIKELEKGRIPWQKPWMSMGLQTGAYNRITKKPYSILNQMLLCRSGEYATFRQWSTLGGHIQSGAKSEIVVFWKINEYEEITETGDTEIKKIPLLRYYRVFHISQVEGVEPLPKMKTHGDIVGIEAGDRLIEEYSSREGIRINMEDYSDQAFYSPMRDYIQVPCKQQYKNINEFYSTLFHEIGHSTGHEKRLNRDMMRIARFGSCDYSKEELVAEITSSMLMNHLSIETEGTFQNSVAYIKSWLSKLQDDKNLIVSSSSRAEKALKYILYGKEGI